MIVQISTIRDGAKTPTQSYIGDAGWDLYAYQHCLVPPKHNGVIVTGICIAIPDGWCAHIVGRSSALRKGLVVAEAIIDSGYRGEMSFIVTNTTDNVIHVRSLDRLAQIIFIPVPKVEWVPVSQMPESERGTSGYGSSGR